MEVAIPCQNAARCSPLSESGGDTQPGAGRDFTHQDARLSTFLRQSARAERGAPCKQTALRAHSRGRIGFLQT